MPDAEIVIWGPPAAETLRERLARYLSPPLAPVHLREFPARISFRACPQGEWEIGPARIHAAPVAHPGPTLGYRISEGDASSATSPDQDSPGPPLSTRERRSLPGFDLAHGASLLVHDCQYTDDEYPSHIGWGHSTPRRRARLRTADRGTSPPPSSTTTRSTTTSSSTGCTPMPLSAGLLPDAPARGRSWPPSCKSSNSNAPSWVAATASLPAASCQ